MIRVSELLAKLRRLEEQGDGDKQIYFVVINKKGQEEAVDYGQITRIKEMIFIDLVEI